jgi:hypothetical protein
MSRLLGIKRKEWPCIVDKPGGPGWPLFSQGEVF